MDSTTLFAPLTVSSAQYPNAPQGYVATGDAYQPLDWSFVESQLAAASFYWLNTVDAEAQPHAVPLWGLYFQGHICFDGHPQTRWLRNIREQKQVVVHLPSAEQVVIVHGVVHLLEDAALKADAWRDLDQLYRTKYGVPHGSPWVAVRPKKVLAWNGINLSTMTRWTVKKSEQ